MTIRHHYVCRLLAMALALSLPVSASAAPMSAPELSAYVDSMAALLGIKSEKSLKAVQVAAVLAVPSPSTAEMREKHLRHALSMSKRLHMQSAVERRLTVKRARHDTVRELRIMNDHGDALAAWWLEQLQSGRLVKNG